MTGCPCKTCERSRQGCGKHDTCEEYIEWRNKRNEALTRRHLAKVNDYTGPKSCKHYTRPTRHNTDDE